MIEITGLVSGNLQGARRLQGGPDRPEAVTAGYRVWLRTGATVSPPSGGRPCPVGLATHRRLGCSLRAILIPSSSRRVDRCMAAACRVEAATLLRPRSSLRAGGEHDECGLRGAGTADDSGGGLSAAVRTPSCLLPESANYCTFDFCVNRPH